MAYTKTQQLNSKPKGKRKKLQSMQNLRKKAWTVFSLWIRNRDKKCVTCGSIKSLQAGHYVHRNCLDFNEKNINAQCAGCNMYKSGNLVVYAVYLEKKYGYGIIQELEKKGREVKKFNREELELIIEMYSE